MPQHRAPDRGDASRAHIGRVRIRCHERGNHGRLGRSRDRLMSKQSGVPVSMTETSAQMAGSRPAAVSEGFDLGRLLLRGRAFFALIAIIIVFSVLSPYYFSLSNFLTM